MSQEGTKMKSNNTIASPTNVYILVIHVNVPGITVPQYNKEGEGVLYRFRETDEGKKIVCYDVLKRQDEYLTFTVEQLGLSPDARVARCGYGRPHIPEREGEDNDEGVELTVVCDGKHVRVDSFKYLDFSLEFYLQ